MSPTSYQAAPPRNVDGKLRDPPGNCQGARDRDVRVLFSNACAGQRDGADFLQHLRAGNRVARAGARDYAARSFLTAPGTERHDAEDLDLRSSRFAWISGLTALLAVLATGEARAAAEVSRFSVVVSGMPSSVQGGDFNTLLEFINDTQLTPRGLEGMQTVGSAWMFEAQMRYFVRSNMAVNAGVGQIRAKSDREYLPSLGLAIQLHAEMLSVPVHVGGAYYLEPYNQGDFQARAYFGAGVLSLVYNRALFQQSGVGIPGLPSFTTAGTQDSPGYYLEAGGHMFFASRFSIMLGAMYRSAKIERLVDRDTGAAYLNPDGSSYTLDFTGVSGRFGLGIGF